jgi:hypothetical protein
MEASALSLDRAAVRVRLAGDDDVDTLVRLAARYYLSFPATHALPANIDYMRHLAGYFLKQHDAAFLLAENGSAEDAELLGLLGVVLVPSAVSEEFVAYQLFAIHLDEAAALPLMQTAEQWARDRHVRLFQVRTDTSIGAEFYRSLGFEPVATVYQRRTE